MKIELSPKIIVTSKEKHTADYFCEMCENLAEAINDCYDECDDIYTMIEDNILLDWNDFITAVKRFTSFIASYEED